MKMQELLLQQYNAPMVRENSMRKEKKEETKKGQTYYAGIYKNSRGEVVMGNPWKSEAEAEIEKGARRIWEFIKLVSFEVE